MAYPPKFVDHAKWAEFETFVRAQRYLMDTDPAYPVVAALTETWDDDTADRFALLYVAYYHLPSALIVFDRFGTDWWNAELETLPTGVERRSFRGPTAKIARHLCDLQGRIDGAGSVRDWLSAGWGTGDGLERWTATREALGEVWGNGRWATYKTAELLKAARGWPLVPTDAGHADSSGPRKGLNDLALGFMPEGNGADAIAELDRLTDEIVTALWVEHRGIDVAEVETHLCDFHSHLAGRYEPGHDVLLLHEQIVSCPNAKIRDALTDAWLRSGLPSVVDVAEFELCR